MTCCRSPVGACETVLTGGLEGLKGHLVELLPQFGNFSGPASVLIAIGKVRDFEDYELWIECCHGYCHPTD